MIRIEKGFDIFDVGSIMETIKDYYKERSLDRIEYDIEFAEDTINDNNNIEFFIQVGYALKTLKLAILILTTSYIVGVVWYIICQITLLMKTEESTEEFFNEVNGLTEKDD